MGDVWNNVIPRHIIPSKSVIVPPTPNGGVEMVVMLLIATRVIHKAYSGEEFAKMTKVPFWVLQK